MYTHLKLKTEYSICSSTLKIKEAVSLMKKLEMKSVAICDDGNLFGSLEFANECTKAGIKPIIGVEMQLCREGLHQIGKVSFYAENQEGYINLLQITNSNEAVNNSQNILFPTLEKFSSNIIAISPSVEVLKILKNLLPQNKLFAEISRYTNEKYEIDAENILVQYAGENGIPLVATNDSYFQDFVIFPAQDALFCVKNGNFTLEDDRKKMTPNHYLKTTDEMQKLFSDIPFAVLHTNFIADACNYFPKPQNPMLPKFAENEHTELERQVWEGLDLRIKNFGITKGYSEDDYRKRIQYEIEVISKMGFEGYFLIVSDFIKWGKNNGVAIGPGRGSGAGSMVAYCLYITDLDPLRYGLLFERFLNPERVSMPDFDIDFCQEERYKVINYVQERYGREKVASIVTFGRLQARAVLKDVGRVLQIPYTVVDRICKMVPFNPVAPVTLEQAIAMDVDLQEQKANDEIIENLIDIGITLEGLVRHISTHAAGVIIGNNDLSKIVPLYQADDQELPAVGYSMKMAEMAGLVKFDFLGLKTLTVIKKVCTLVKERYNIEITPENIPLDDAETFKFLQNGLTKGIFQLDSSICRDAMKQMKIDVIDDIIALTSLNRPGPMENIPSFIARKTGQEKVEYVHPLLEDVLRETYGIIIYQEQVIKIAQVLSGYSLGEADLLRRAMGKKNKEEMDQQREIFVNGAKKNGLTEKKAEEIFALVEKFAGYGFNKSHAAAYSVISFYTAYLKTHYKKEFYTSILNLDIHNTDNINIFIAEARQAGVEFILPDINTSGTYFKITDGKIEYALSAIKGVGELATIEIENVRKNGTFKDVFDFVERIDSKHANKKVLEGLIKASAFRNIYPNTNELLQNSQVILSYAGSNKDDDNLSLFGESEIKSKPVLQKTKMFEQNEQLEAEFEAFGFYLSSHPLLQFVEVMKKYDVKSYEEMNEFLPETGEVYVKMAGVISILKQRSGNRGRFAFLHISDLTNAFEVAIFKDDLIEKNRDNLVVGKVLIFNISASRHESGNMRLIVNDITTMENVEKIAEFKKSSSGNFPKKNKEKNDQLKPVISEILYAKKIVISNYTPILLEEIKNFQNGSTQVVIKLKEYNVYIGNFAVPVKFMKKIQEQGCVEAIE